MLSYVLEIYGKMDCKSGFFVGQGGPVFLIASKYTGIKIRWPAVLIKFGRKKESCYYPPQN